MSFTLHGIGVSGGIAIGHAHLVSHATLEVDHFVLPPHQIAAESLRFDAAIQTVRAEFDALRGEIPAGAPAEFSAFVDLHRMILDDATLSAEPRRIIETEQCNAEWAIKAIRAGKNVLVEKPIALSAYDADAIFHEAKKAGVFAGEAVLTAW